MRLLLLQHSALLSLLLLLLLLLCLFAAAAVGCTYSAFLLGPCEEVMSLQFVLLDGVEVLSVGVAQPLSEAVETGGRLLLLRLPHLPPRPAAAAAATNQEQEVRALIFAVSFCIPVALFSVSFLCLPVSSSLCRDSKASCCSFCCCVLLPSGVSFSCLCLCLPFICLLFSIWMWLLTDCLQCLLAAVLLLLCFYLAAALLLSRCCFAAVLLLSCCCVAAILLLPCFYLAAVLLLRMRCCSKETG